MDYKKNNERAANAFKECIQSPLTELLSAEKILSLESEANNSTIASLLDRGGSSDLLVNFEVEGILFCAASRISFVTDDWKKDAPPKFSMTLRNSVKGNCDKTELNKLHRMVTTFRMGMPVVLPRYLCISQVDERDNKYNLLELFAIETIPLIENIFDTNSTNIQRLRLDFGDIIKNKKENDKPASVYLSESRADLAGIRATKTGDSFFFFTKEFLDENAIPYRRYEKKE